MLRSHRHIHCLEMFESSYAYLYRLYVFNCFVCQTSSKQHPSPKVDKEGGFSLRSNHLHLLTLAWFVSSLSLYNVRFVTPISDAIWTFQIANPCFFLESRNTASLLGLSQDAAGTHCRFFGLLHCSLIAVAGC